MYEMFFRVIFTILVIGVFSASIFFRMKANLAGDKLNRRKEGLPILISRSIFGVLLLIFLVSYIIRPEATGWSRFGLPVWLRFVGIGLALIISPLVLWVFISLGRNITDTVDTRKDHVLVTNGIYKYIRHPLYTLGAGFFVSLFLISESWIFLLLAFFSFLVIGIFRTGAEEKELLEKFGQEYIEYKEKTGKYFPKIFSKGK